MCIVFSAYCVTIKRVFRPNMTVMVDRALKTQVASFPPDPVPRSSVTVSRVVSCSFLARISSFRVTELCRKKSQASSGAKIMDKTS